MAPRNFGTLKNNEILVSNHPLTIRPNAPETEFRSRTKHNIDTLWQRQVLIIQDLQGITSPEQSGSDALGVTIGVDNGNIVNPPFSLSCTSSVSIGEIDVCSFIQMDDNVPLRLGTGTGLKHDATLSYNGTDVILNPKVEGSGKFSVSGNILSDNFDTTSITNSMFIHEDAGTTTATGTISIGAQTGGFGAAGMTGINNISIGFRAHDRMLSGSNNTAIGPQAGRVISTGLNNVCISIDAGSGIVSGSRNICIGSTCGISIGSGNDNTILGHQAYFSGNLSQNVVIGSQAGKNILCSNSVIIGRLAAGKGSGSGFFFSVAVGEQSAARVTGSFNTMLGYLSGENASASCLMMGHRAGQNETGSNKLYIDVTNTALPLIFGEFDNRILDVNGALTVKSTVAGALTIGTGTPGIDYILKFDGDSNDGILTWKESLDYFEFSDATFHVLGERAFFASTSNYIDTVSANGNSGILIKGDFSIYLSNNEILIGDQTANDILLRFDTSTNDGLITWSRTNDRFEFADDVLLDETLTITGETSANDDILLASGKTIGRTNAGGLTFTSVNDGSFSGSLQVNGELDVGLNNPASLVSSGTINLRIGMIRGTPTNVTDAYVAVHDTGGPGTTAGDLILIARSSVTANIRMFTGSTTPLERLTILADGKVGIGLSAPVANLHIEDADTGLTPDSDGDIICIEGATGVGATMGMSFLSSVTSEVFILFGDSGNNKAGSFSYTHSGDTFRWETGASERMRLNGNGDLLIGHTASTDSQDKLQISSDSNTAVRSNLSCFSTTTTVNSTIRLRKSNSNTVGTITETVTGHIFGDLDFEGVDSGDGYAIGGRIRVVQNGAAGASVLPGDMILSTWNGTSENSNQLVLANDGFIGINQINPVRSLDINGDMRTVGVVIFEDILQVTGVLTAIGNIVIGNGGAGVDYTLTFDGESNNGILTWKEDEDYFEFSDDTFHASGEKAFFENTNNFISTVLANGASGISITGENAVYLMANEILIGANEDVDVVLTFDALSNNGVITWMEDEDQFEFDDDILMNSTESLYFRDTDLSINSATDGNLDLTADTSINLNSPVNITGGLQLPIISKITTYAPTSSDYTILCDATSGPFSINLPAAASHSGRIYVIMKTDSSGNAVTVDGNASETINGSATSVISVQYDVIMIHCDGSNWFII